MTDIFLGILINFSEQISLRIPFGNCFYHLREKERERVRVRERRESERESWIIEKPVNTTAIGFSKEKASQKKKESTTSHCTHFYTLHHFKVTARV